MTKFHEELFGCFSNVPVCLWGTFVPAGALCIQASAVNKANNQGAIVPYLLVACLACIGGAVNRGKIRDHFSIEGGFVGDMFIWWFCAPCAACQEYREVLSRHHHGH
jgi:Cys-rich protein (TIGR01571 family)